MLVPATIPVTASFQQSFYVTDASPHAKLGWILEIEYLGLAPGLPPNSNGPANGAIFLPAIFIETRNHEYKSNLFNDQGRQDLST